MNRKSAVIYSILIFLFIGWALSPRQSRPPLNTQELPSAKGADTMPTKYLAFQIFTQADDKTGRASFPPLLKGVANTVDAIIRQIGTVGSKTTKLGFIPGPLSFNHTDTQIQQLMRDSFAIALKNNIAVGFHVDDSMFWERLSYLSKPENVEWTDWKGTPNTGRRLDWSSTPTKIMPQLCLNSPAVLQEVKKRSALIGAEVKRGLAALKAAKKEHLFIGVINGWEAQIGRDFVTGDSLGYNALKRKGFSAANTQDELDMARSNIVREFVDFWAKSLSDAGVPDAKIYSHIAFMPEIAYDANQPPGQPVKSYLQAANFTPPRVAFGPHHNPGFSTYPMPGHLDAIYDEVKKHGDIAWASSEGTAMDPGQAEKIGKSMSMEAYLGNLYNHGADLVNVFGWAVGDANNPFRKVAENPKSLEAYRKFLRGEKLQEDQALGGMPTTAFITKMHRIQKEMPVYAQKYGPKDIQPLAQKLEKYMKAGQYSEADKAADEILKLIGK
ncbi:MAG: ATP synthase subunit B family protein [Armatimonadota bacterium]